MEQDGSKKYNRGMDYFYELYASYILKHAIALSKDDVLSINTEEKFVPFARLLASKAKEITDNGSYLVIIENKKAKEAVEIFSDYLIEKSPTVFIHLQGREEEPDFEEEKIYSAREAQLFSHLASPIILPEAEVCFLTVPMPDISWAQSLGEELNEKNLVAMISDFLELENIDSYQSFRDALEIDSYDKRNLSYHKGRRAHLYTDDGMTDLYFSFADNSEFKSLVYETNKQRKFIPHLFSSSYFRAIDFRSAEGHVETRLPYRLFGKTIYSSSFEFENGRIKSFSASDEDAKRIMTYLKQDDMAGALAEIEITETFSRIADIELFCYPEWDKLRGIVLTLGAPRSEAVAYIDEDEAIRNGIAASLFTLSLPLGSSDITLEIIDDEKEEILYSDGIIEDYQ